MIPAAHLHRLLVHVLRSVLEDESDERSTTTDQQRERLIDWAGTHELDLQDVATLYRVASGEGFAKHHDEDDETGAPRWIAPGTRWITEGPK